MWEQCLRKKEKEKEEGRASVTHSKGQTLGARAGNGGSSAGQPEVSRTFPSPCIKCFPALSRSHTRENARCLLTRTPGVNSRLGCLSKPEMLLLHLLGEFQVPSQGLALQQDPGAWIAPPPLQPPNPFLLLQSNAIGFLAAARPGPYPLPVALSFLLQKPHLGASLPFIASKRPPAQAPRPARAASPPRSCLSLPLASSCHGSFQIPQVPTAASLVGRPAPANCTHILAS